MLCLATGYFSFEGLTQSCMCFDFVPSAHRNPCFDFRHALYQFLWVRLKLGICFHSGSYLFILQWELYSTFSRTLFQSQFINLPFWPFFSYVLEFIWQFLYTFIYHLNLTFCVLCRVCIQYFKSIWIQILQGESSCWCVAQVKLLIDQDHLDNL